MHTNKTRRASRKDEPLPAGTIIELRGMLPELAAVSPGKTWPPSAPTAAPPDAEDAPPCAHSPEDESA